MFCVYFSFWYCVQHTVIHSYPCFSFVYLNYFCDITIPFFAKPHSFPGNVEFGREGKSRWAVWKFQLFQECEIGYVNVGKNNFWATFFLQLIKNRTEKLMCSLSFFSERKMPDICATNIGWKAQ